jgi:hypothetical protein
MEAKKSEARFVDADGERLAYQAAADLLAGNRVDESQAAVWFALRGDHLVYAGARQPLLPVPPLHFEASPLVFYTQLFFPFLSRLQIFWRCTGVACRLL